MPIPIPIPDRQLFRCRSFRRFPQESRQIHCGNLGIDQGATADVKVRVLEESPALREGRARLEQLDDHLVTAGGGAEELQLPLDQQVRGLGAAGRTSCGRGGRVPKACARVVCRGDLPIAPSIAGHGPSPATLSRPSALGEERQVDRTNLPCASAERCGLGGGRPAGLAGSEKCTGKRAVARIRRRGFTPAPRRRPIGSQLATLMTQQ